MKTLKTHVIIIKSNYLIEVIKVHFVMQIDETIASIHFMNR